LAPAYLESQLPEEPMPAGLTSPITIRCPAMVDELHFTTDAARLREIEALEAANFALRDQITRLKLHNATLDRMLKQRNRPAGGCAGALPTN
jgi:hypothetical protein